MGCRLAFISFIYHVKTAGLPSRRGGNVFVHIETHLISVSTLLAECCARAPSESAKNIYEIHLSTYHQTEAETDGVTGKKKRNCFVYSVAGLECVVVT